MLANKKLPEADDPHVTASDAPSQNGFGSYYQFLANNKKWWLTPIVVMLVFVCVLIVLSQSSTAPFTYTLS